jgi:hypothetical protein
LGLPETALANYSCNFSQIPELTAKHKLPHLGSIQIILGTLSMKRFLTAAVLVFFAFSPSYAQSTKSNDPDVEPGSFPREEISVVYSYFNVNPGGNTPVPDFNGVSTSFTYNLNWYLGLTADLGGYYDGDYPDMDHVSAYVVSYLFGPRISFRHYRLVTPSIQLLLGGASGRGSLVFRGTPSSLNGFEMATGGSLDWRLNNRITVRLPQLEYVYSHSNSNVAGIPNHQNNARASVGVVFRLGWNR